MRKIAVLFTLVTLSVIAYAQTPNNKAIVQKYHEDACAFLSEFLSDYSPFNGEDYGRWCRCEIIDVDRSTEEDYCLVFASDLFWERD